MRYQYIRRDGRPVRLVEREEVPSAVAVTLRPRPPATTPAPAPGPRRLAPMPAIPALPPEALEISAWW